MSGVMLRLIAIAGSVCLHGALAFALMENKAGTQSFDIGTGEDVLRIEQGIAIEGLAKFGDAAETIVASEAAPPTPQTVAAAAIEEIKAIEPDVAEVVPDVVEAPPPDVADVIMSDNGIEADAVIAAEPPPIKEVQPEEAPRPPQAAQVARLQEMPTVDVQEAKEASRKTFGGDAEMFNAYKGDLRTAIEKSKRQPKKTQSGTVRVKFEINRRGEIVTRSIVESSGHARLDREALAWLDRTNFPAFPKDVSDDRVTLTIPLRYVIRQ